jgi:hypothetical protein
MANIDDMYYNMTAKNDGPVLSSEKAPLKGN